MYSSDIDHGPRSIKDISTEGRTTNISSSTHHPSPSWQSIGRRLLQDTKHRRVFGEDSFAWHTIDVVRLRGEDFDNDVILIGCGAEPVTTLQAINALAAVAMVLERHEAFKMVDVQIHQSTFANACGWINSECDDNTASLLPLVGLELAPLHQPNRRGTAGLYLHCPALHKTFVASARHVIDDSNSAIGQSGGQKMIAITDTTLQELKTKVDSDVKNMYDERERMIGRVITGPKRDLAEAALCTASAAQDILQPVLEERKLPIERIIGSVYCAPALTPSNPYTEDWSLVTIEDETMVPSSRRLFLGDNPPSGAEFPDDRILEVQGMISIGELKNSHLGERDAIKIIMRGASSGLTVGFVNSVQSVTRKSLKVESRRRFVCLVRRRNRHSVKQAFSQEGDSGAAVVDVAGRVVGILTGGWGVTEANDVRYVTPWEWVLPRMERLVGHDMHVLYFERAVTVVCTWSRFGQPSV